MTAELFLTCDVCGESWRADALPPGWQSFDPSDGQAAAFPGRFRCGAVDLCPDCQGKGVEWNPTKRDFVTRSLEPV